MRQKSAVAARSAGVGPYSAASTRFASATNVVAQIHVREEITIAPRPLATFKQLTAAIAHRLIFECTWDTEVFGRLFWGNGCTGDVRSAVFTFDLERTVPAGVGADVSFVVRTVDGQRWTKKVRFSVAAPERSELLQNYPNPFNPSTTIPFVLSAPSVATVKVYHVTGQEVATLVNAPLPAGEHRAQFEARGLSSGSYAVGLVATRDGGAPFIARKAMLLVK